MTFFSHMSPQTLCKDFNTAEKNYTCKYVISKRNTRG